MAKPKCKLGGKCFYQKSWFYGMWFDDGDSCPHRAYKDSNREEECDGKLVLIFNAGCKNSMYP